MKISVVVEVTIHDEYLKQIETWGVEPSDHIATWVPCSASGPLTELFP